jgi:polysaccharide deacetylase 2 family uncharacterized protein YibQ
MPTLPAWLRLRVAEPLDHVKLSAAAAGGLGLITLGAIQIFGDPHAAAPRRILPLDGSGGAAFRTTLSDVVLDPESATAAALHDDYAGQGDAPLTAAGADPLAPAHAAPLPPAPIAGLTQRGPLGPLPAIGSDGKTPLSAYRRPFTPTPGKKMVGLIVGGLGFNAALTQAAIEQLPADVTLSFVPYADNLQNWINAARARGHEVMIEVPMESFDSAETDTGPQTLLAAGAAKDNVGRLENVLSRGAGYFAVSNYQGAKFAQSGAASAPGGQPLKSRGLGFVSTGIGARAALGAEAAKAGLPFAAADRVLDAQREANAIADQLDSLEAMAQQDGDALGAGFAYPVTIDQIKLWASALDSHGVSLAPASAVMEARAQRR